MSFLSRGFRGRRRDDAPSGTRFAAAGAQYAFVDTRLGLDGPPRVVQHWPNHEDHLHVRLTDD